MSDLNVCIFLEVNILIETLYNILNLILNTIFKQMELICIYVLSK